MLSVLLCSVINKHILQKKEVLFSATETLSPVEGIIILSGLSLCLI